MPPNNGITSDKLGNFGYVLSVGFAMDFLIYNSCFSLIALYPSLRLGNISADSASVYDGDFNTEISGPPKDYHYPLYFL